MANWRQIYTAAILSTDPDPASFDVVLDETAHAMELLLNELSQLQGSMGERREIALAAKSLLIKRAESEESRPADMRRSLMTNR